MGWLYCETSKQDLIERLTRPWDGDQNYSVRALKHCIRKEDPKSEHYLLWAVFELTFKKPCKVINNWQTSDTARVINCFVLDHDPEAKSQWNSWGYKSEAESSGLSYINCPLSYLKLADAGIDKRWRADVKEYHQSKKKR